MIIQRYNFRDEYSRSFMQMESEGTNQDLLNINQ